MAAASRSSRSYVPKKMATNSYLPEELWEGIFKFLNDGDNNFYSNMDEYGMLDSNLSAISLRNSFKSLSVVSKEFLSITNSLRFSVTISDQTIPSLHPLFQRFPNVTSLNITLRESDLDELLTQISTLAIDLRSLALYHPTTVPVNGLRALSKKMKNLTSFTGYQFASMIDRNDLFFISNCFPLLEELILTDIGYSRFIWYLDDDDEDDDQLLALPKLRKIALSPNFMGRRSIDYLCKNCDLLQEVTVIEDLPSPLLDIDDDDKYCECGFQFHEDDTP
ncbi:putative leucine-rich repeat domain, L domain-containing protein [Medicago truncatula]|nr:putative leucine-rich repeat domain, L domain-containing protein [Medicago truncatula]